jgi:hypothetical protein
MEEVPENGRESSHSAHAKGMNELVMPKQKHENGRRKRSCSRTTG